MTAESFADTNIVIYAEGSDVSKAQRATAILESSPVISSQNERRDCDLSIEIKRAMPLAVAAYSAEFYLCSWHP